jgi:hypothetical protein
MHILNNEAIQFTSTELLDLVYLVFATLRIAQTWKGDLLTSFINGGGYHILENLVLSHSHTVEEMTPWLHTLHDWVENMPSQASHVIELLIHCFVTVTEETLRAVFLEHLTPIVLLYPSAAHALTSLLQSLPANTLTLRVFFLQLFISEHVSLFDISQKRVLCILSFRVSYCK